MPIGVLFWVIMIIWLLLGFYWNRADFSRGNYGVYGGNIILFVLLALVGWKVFGPILQ